MGSGHHLQFTALPFGLSSAPRVFTKCMAPVVAYLRCQGIQICLYLDDWLLKGTSPGQVRRSLDLVRSTCNDLSLLIVTEKSTLMPVQRIEFIGAVLDSTRDRAFIPKARFQAMVDLIVQVRRHPITMAHTCLRLVDHMAACMYVVRHAWLRLPPLHTWLATVYVPSRHHWDQAVTVLDCVLSSLNYWLDPKSVLQGVDFVSLSPSLTLVSDASDLGWGAHLGECSTQGRWMQHNLALYIDVRAVAWPVRRFCPT